MSKHSPIHNQTTFSHEGLDCGYDPQSNEYWVERDGVRKTFTAYLETKAHIDSLLTGAKP